jgi:transcriptional regulator with XRE-family HTH domain
MKGKYYMDQIKIGNFIKQKRKEKNITQNELSEKLNITNRAISKWENGICMPDSGIIPELCEILNITINDLFSGK